MYRGFKITKETIEKILEHKEHYRKEYKKEAEGMKENVRKKLQEYLTTNKKIDVEVLQSDWFPTEKYDIFLSHSHVDIEDIEALAGYLVQEKGLKVFVDSFIWGHYDILLGQLNNRYNQTWESDTFDITYNHQGANWCCTNVTIILNSALQEVIDKSEALFFYNTPNSITHDYKNKDRTESPWIFSEIETSRIIRKNMPQRMEAICESAGRKYSDAYNMKKAKFSYWLNHNHLMEIEREKFDKWINIQNSVSPLENLYIGGVVDRRRKAETQLDKLYSIVGDEK